MLKCQHYKAEKSIFEPVGSDVGWKAVSDMFCKVEIMCDYNIYYCDFRANLVIEIPAKCSEFCLSKCGNVDTTDPALLPFEYALLF